MHECVCACERLRQSGRAWSIVGNIRSLPRRCRSHRGCVVAAVVVVVDLRLSATSNPPLLLLGPFLCCFTRCLFYCRLVNNAAHTHTHSHTHTATHTHTHTQLSIESPTSVVNILAVYCEPGSGRPGRG